MLNRKIVNRRDSSASWFHVARLRACMQYIAYYLHGRAEQQGNSSAPVMLCFVLLKDDRFLGGAAQLQVPGMKRTCGRPSTEPPLSNRHHAARGDMGVVYRFRRLPDPTLGVSMFPCVPSSAESLCQPLPGFLTRA